MHIHTHPPRLSLAWGRSSIMCLKEIGRKISSLKIEDRIVMLALDISKAYDGVNLALPEKILLNKSVLSEMIAWILKFFFIFQKHTYDWKISSLGVW